MSRNLNSQSLPHIHNVLLFLWQQQNTMSSSRYTSRFLTRDRSRDESTDSDKSGDLLGSRLNKVSQIQIYKPADTDQLTKCAAVCFFIYKQRIGQDNNIIQALSNVFLFETTPHKKYDLF